MQARFSKRHEGAYLAIVALMFACRLALLPFEITGKSAGQQLALEWWFPLTVALFGVLGLVFSRAAGFPDVLPRQTNSRRLSIAILLGLLTGMLSAVVDWLQPITSGLESAHHPLPAAVPYYIYGGIVSEVVYHFTPIVVAVWLAKRIAGGSLRSEESTFWVALVLLSAWEQKYFFTHPEIWTPLEFARNLISYAANAFEIWLLRRWGFTMAITQRLASYSIWHLAWPALSGT
jgi:hypothetical protein